MARPDYEIDDATGGEDEDAAGSNIAEKLPTCGPGAKKQHEDDEEDFSQIAENFSKIAEKVSKAVPRPSALPSIYVVPRYLVEGRVDSYEPEVVCIGPLFDQTERRKKPRRKLESHKWWCLRKLLLSAQMPAGTDRRQAEDAAWDPDVLRKCLDSLRELQDKIVESYEEISVESVGGSDTLALMMLLDGSFLHFLMMGDESSCLDYGFSQMIGYLVIHDLLLLKNQIPFFILQALFKHLIIRASDKDDILIEWGLQLFSRLNSGPTGDGGIDVDPKDVLHLLNLYHISIIGKFLKAKTVGENPTVKKPLLLSIISKLSLGAKSRSNTCHKLCISITCCKNNKKNNSTTEEHDKSTKSRRSVESTLSATKSSRSSLPWVPCAKELEEAGITFRAKKPKKSAPNRETCSFLDVSFSHGILEIPQLKLDDGSEALFRNLIAFEQIYLTAPLHVTAYVMFMECLVKTPKDMRLLLLSGVLENHMSGNERDAVATGFFSNVCAHAWDPENENQLAKVMNAVVKYQSTKWRRWRAMLKRNYFSNPWVTTSVIAAFLLLLMTGLQTFFAVYGYYNPYTRNQ